MSRYFKTEDDDALFDIYELFKYYNQYFFNGILEKCTVGWSQKMTLCAGTCKNQGFQSCTIRLSAPLLKLRTANQLKQTLLHEMIHAYLFITNPKACLVDGGHGKQFQQIMKNINQISNLNVTIYHTFHNEVNSYRTHVWKCNGNCQHEPPFYGYVRRAMNRKPQPADHWFNQHKRFCGGDFIKISGPESKNQTAEIHKQKEEKKKWGKGKSIEDYIKDMNKESKVKKDEKEKSKGKTIQEYLKQMSAGQKTKKERKKEQDEDQDV